MTEKKDAPVIGQEAVQYQNLSLGSQGEDVKKLQTALGFTGSDVDGIYGKKTQQAVMDYQNKKNLTVDGIAGQQTQSALYSGSNGATSDTINQANQLLNKNLGSGSYTPVWADAAQQYLEQYQGRDPFSYDFATDALYQQMADQYAQGARLSMMDTMGQAAAMTGGYGNTWAQHVGQQAYDQTMSQLTGIIPELEQRAYDRYQQEGNDLLTQYSLYRDLENQEYAKWRDAVADYQWKQSFDASRYSGGGGTVAPTYTGMGDRLAEIQKEFMHAETPEALQFLAKIYEAEGYNPQTINAMVEMRLRELAGTTPRPFNATGSIMSNIGALSGLYDKNKLFG